MTIKSALTTVPDNTNFLQTTQFIFQIPKLTISNYFCQSVLLPSVATNEVLVPTPFSETYRHGDKLIYEPLVLTFLVDEDMRTWEEIYNWLRRLTFPTSFDEYGKNHNDSLYYDATLEVFKNSNLPNLRFKFYHCHPTVLGSVQFIVTDDANITPVADLTLRYDYFELERIA